MQHAYHTICGLLMHSTPVLTAAGIRAGSRLGPTTP
jgi:hypothetical protein